MNGITFYREENEKNVIAVIHNNKFMSGGKTCYECISAVYFEDNSPVCGGSVSKDFLNNLEKISEQKARKIHPNLFTYLDSGSN